MDQLEWIDSWKTYSDEPTQKKVVELIHIGNADTKPTNPDVLPNLLRRTRELFETKIVINMNWATTTNKDVSLPIDFTYSKPVEELLQHDPIDEVY